MCTKKYDEIDFNKISRNALKKNMKALMKHEICKINFENYEIENFKKMEISDFIKEICINNHSSEIIQKFWQEHKFSINLIDQLIDKSVCILDLSKDTFNNNNQYIAIGIALLVNSISILNNKIFIGNNCIKLTNYITDDIKIILDNCGPCNSNIIKYFKLIKKYNEDFNNIIFVTTKDISNIEWLLNKNISLIHYKVNEFGYDIIHYNNKNISKSYIINKNNEIINENIINIINIIEKSDELNNKIEPIIIIIILLLLWFILMYLR